jgi:hypothetical protein
LSIGRSLAALEIARPDQHSEGVYREIPCDLKTDSLISPGDQGDGFFYDDAPAPSARRRGNSSGHRLGERYFFALICNRTDRCIF